MVPAATLKERVNDLEIKVNGNGGKGIHRRLDEIEERSDSHITREEFLQAIREIEQKIKEAFENQRKTWRWCIEQAIRFAPWVAVGISLYLLSRGRPAP